MLNLKLGDRVTWEVNGKAAYIKAVTKVTKNHFTVEQNPQKYRLRDGRSLTSDSYSTAHWRQEAAGDKESIKRQAVEAKVRNFAHWGLLPDTELSQVSAIIDAARERQKEPK